MYIPTDRVTGRPRGFAFATFSTEQQAAEAIRIFNQRDVGGRRLNVNAAEERPRRRSVLCDIVRISLVEPGPAGQISWSYAKL